jgi:hypothetical protein
VNYGRAVDEAAANGGTSPALAAALADPLVKPYADMVRGAQRFQNADDATVAMETAKQISRQRKGVLKRRDGPNGYDAKADLEAGDLAAAAELLKTATAAPSQRPPIALDVAPETFETAPRALREERPTMSGPVGTGPLSERTTAPTPTISEVLRNANNGTPLGMQGPDGPAFQLRGQPKQVAPGVQVETPGMRIELAPAEDVPPVMPSFPAAVSEHARMMGEHGTFKDMADATTSIMGGKRVLANKLDTRGKARNYRSDRERANARPGRRRTRRHTRSGEGRNAPECANREEHCVRGLGADPSSRHEAEQGLACCSRTRHKSRQRTRVPTDRPG